jgi:endonuclease YncB( thermonuclease family)
MKKHFVIASFVSVMVLVSCDVGITFPSSSSESLVTTSISSSSSSAAAEYFYPVDIPYDGFRIDPMYVESDTFYETIQGVNWGNGGAFPVEYNPPLGIGRCIDGDTTVFGFPNDVANLIQSNPKRVRYLNIDTPETSGTPEPWGLLAKEYACDRLLDAHSILIQTDPGDKLLDPYGRLLGWVWIQPTVNDAYELLNYWLVRQGLAEVKYLFGAGETQATVYENKTYTEWMYIAQERAEADGYGMHSTLRDPYA